MEDNRGIVAKLVAIIGALLFFTIVFIVGLAFVDFIESAHEKTIRDAPQRRSLS